MPVLQTLVPQIARMLGADDEDVETACKAAALCKSDLVTAMVVEMTSLQGIMGEIYALESGVQPAVAQAIREHYLPRFDGDGMPKSEAGLALSLAGQAGQPRRSLWYWGDAQRQRRSFWPAPRRAGGREWSDSRKS